MRYFTASSDFRSSFSYNNLMYGVLSYITEVVAGDGTSWEDLMREEIFAPLSMTDAGFTHQMDITRSDIAHPCFLDFDQDPPVLREVDLEFQR